ncbi:hypothetical protein B0H14DRAFT_3524915 [Mycena olivaceomarginata]|nr:hypothetical protein B0H14DRAFT_3524915 [Mycena olivaceomarginata]
MVQEQEKERDGEGRRERKESTRSSRKERERDNDDRERRKSRDHEHDHRRGRDREGKPRPAFEVISKPDADTFTSKFVRQRAASDAPIPSTLTHVPPRPRRSSITDPSTQDPVTDPDRKLKRRQPAVFPCATGAGRDAGRRVVDFYMSLRGKEAGRCCRFRVEHSDTDADTALAIITSHPILASPRPFSSLCTFASLEAELEARSMTSVWSRCRDAQPRKTHPLKGRARRPTFLDEEFSLKRIREAGRALKGTIFAGGDHQNGKEGMMLLVVKGGDTPARTRRMRTRARRLCWDVGEGKDAAREEPYGTTPTRTGTTRET